MAKTIFAQASSLFQNKKKLTLADIVIYKPIAGDDVDQMFAQALAQLGIMHLPAKRLGGGYYILGSKKIYCKIMNGRLVVRVGGGFMGIEQYVEQYG